MKNFSFYLAVVLIVTSIALNSMDHSKVVTMKVPGNPMSPIKIIDTNGDGIADETLQRVQFGSVPGGLARKGKPTPEHQDYFAKHK